MSEDVYQKGTLKKIEFGHIKTVEEKANAILVEKNIVFDSQSYETRLEHLQDAFYQEYFASGEDLYKVTVESEEDHGDIFEAHIKPGEAIEFVLKYHNSGCSMDEALEEAFKKLD